MLFISTALSGEGQEPGEKKVWAKKNIVQTLIATPTATIR
jgi:hypothetical protein